MKKNAVRTREKSNAGGDEGVDSGTGETEKGRPREGKGATGVQKSGSKSGTGKRAADEVVLYNTIFSPLGAVDDGDFPPHSKASGVCGNSKAVIRVETAKTNNGGFASLSLHATEVDMVPATQAHGTQHNNNMKHSLFPHAKEVDMVSVTLEQQYENANHSLPLSSPPDMAVDSNVAKGAKGNLQYFRRKGSGGEGGRSFRDVVKNGQPFRVKPSRLQPDENLVQKWNTVQSAVPMTEDDAAKMDHMESFMADIQEEDVLNMLEFDEYRSARADLESRGLILFFMHRVPSQTDLDRWMRMHWTDKGHVVQSFWGLGSRYVSVVFHTAEAARQVLQYGTWFIAGATAFVQPWRAKFDPADLSQVRYPLWVEFTDIWSELRGAYRCIAERRFGRVLIEPEDQFSLRASPRICVEADLSKKLPDALTLLTEDGPIMQRIRYLNLPNACFGCQTVGHLVKDCPLRNTKVEKTGVSQDRESVPQGGMESQLQQEDVLMESTKIPQLQVAMEEGWKAVHKQQVKKSSVKLRKARRSSPSVGPGDRLQIHNCFDDPRAEFAERIDGLPKGCVTPEAAIPDAPGLQHIGLEPLERALLRHVAHDGSSS